MAREFAKAFYNSPAWRKCRQSFIAYRRTVDGGMCEECGEELGYIVHHKIWITPENINNTNITLNHDNLEYVCHTCHNNIEDREKEKLRYIFGTDGQVYPAPP